MLKRLKVGGRLNLLILVPVLALAALGVLSYQSLKRASLQGEQYQQLEQATDLRADVLPPPASLLESWMLTNRLGVLINTTDSSQMFDRSEVATVIARLSLSERTYRGAYDKWWNDTELDDEVRLRLLGYGGYEADQFYAKMNQLLIPAAEAFNAVDVNTAIDTMKTHFDAQNAEVTRVVTWAEQRVFDTTEENRSLVDNVLRGLLISVAALGGLTLLMAFLVRRSIVRPIKALSGRATAVANQDLPMAVAAVQHVSTGGVQPTLPPFETQSRDEIAELARSFSSVQDTALDLAVEQATARRVVSENLVNIARRSQSLLGRTLGAISNLEENERDPEALEHLFRIDHLTTRMRRNAQSLLVLAGAEPTRLFAPPVPLGDVARAALSEVENFSRIDLGDLSNTYVTGSIASEIAHLFAELLENATTFSPPSTRVQMLGRKTRDGYQVVIVDHGIGLTADELRRANDRLATVDDFDRESTKVLGFQVVARLADRHGIRVVLTHTPGGSGLTSVVFLPSAILEGAPGAAARLGSFSESAPASRPAGGHEEPAVQQSSTLLAVPATELSSDELWEMFTEPAATPRAPAEHASQVDPAPADLPTLASSPARVEAPVVVERAPELPADLSLPTLAQPELTATGLAKRVRGAQMPEVTDGFGASTDVPRPAEQVRSTLASLQRGVDLGRRSADRDVEEQS